MLAGSHEAGTTHAPHTYAAGARRADTDEVGLGWPGRGWITRLPGAAMQCDRPVVRPINIVRSSIGNIESESCDDRRSMASYDAV